MKRLDILYEAMERSTAVLEKSLSSGVLGPCNPRDEGVFPRYGFTDERIEAARNGDLTDLIDGTKTHCVGGFDDQGPTRPIEDPHATMADMMLMAQAGVLMLENYSESAGLCRWKASQEFKTALLEDIAADKELGFHITQSNRQRYESVGELLQRNCEKIAWRYMDPYEGDKIDIEAEVAKIDVEKLRELKDSQLEAGAVSDKKDGFVVYLAETGRLRPDNSLMAMGYIGGGVFTIFFDWDDFYIDPRTDLIARGSTGRNIDYIQLDYEWTDQEWLDTEIALEGQSVDDTVAGAVAAYAKMSRFVSEHGGLNAYEIKAESPAHIKGMFPDKLLDLDQEDDAVRKDLVEYLALDQA
jgi:hypothetical protein